MHTTEHGREQGAGQGARNHPLSPGAVFGPAERALGQRRRGAQLALVGALLVASPRLSHAQSEADRANARTAATAGADAFDDGNFEKAADLFQRAESLVHSPVHRWYIARSANELGQLVRARENCLSVQREGLPEGASAGIVAAFEGCQALLTELEGRIPHLTIEVSGAAAEKPFAVLRNGEAVPPAMIGIPAPVDPGKQTIAVEGEGYEPSVVEVTVVEGANESVHLTLTERAVTPVAAPPAPASEADAAGPEDTEQGLRPPPWSSYLAWGLGLGGVGVGVGFGVLAQNEANRADELCGPGGRAACDPNISAEDLEAAEQANDAAGTNQVISIIGYSAGGVALATGFVLWLVHNGKGKPESAALSAPRLRPVIGLGHLGVAGTF